GGVAAPLGERPARSDRAPAARAARRRGADVARTDGRADGPGRRRGPGGAAVSGLDAILGGRRVVICVGSGGVGKTTTAATIAVGIAADGRRACVVTIDPAQRLAASLGLDELGNEPRRVDGDRFAACGVPLTGELWAMMLDPKATLDDLVGRLAPDAGARTEILGNRIYRELSAAVAGTQEYTAMAKLYDLQTSDRFDVIVLD